MVGWTVIECRAAARNPYVAVGDLGWLKYITRTIYIYPKERRPGWNIVSTFGESQTNWQQGDPTWFPNIAGNVLFGQNTNQAGPYHESSGVIITPVYNEPVAFPDDYLAFDSMVGEIVAGPNTGLWYNCYPSLFKVARMARYNYWISPGATKPSIPATDPNGNPYTNWLTLQANLLQDTCTCSNPSAHGGVGNNIRWIANTWHEKYGCPFSPYQVYLGHQAQIEDAIENGPAYTYDAVYLCDLNFSTTKEGLRAENMSSRFTPEVELNKRAQSVHTFINTPWDIHNFKGSFWNYENGAWVLRSGAFYGCY